MDLIRILRRLGSSVDESLKWRRQADVPDGSSLSTDDLGSGERKVQLAISSANPFFRRDLKRTF
jgi:hypothetical protein